MTFSRHSRSRRSEEAVWAAVRTLADGPDCRATNRELADVAGLKSTDTVKSCLFALEHGGAIKRYDWRDGLAHRTFVLLEHPQAADAMDWIYAPVSPSGHFRLVGA